MVIKKFQGETETEAIMLAKEELGKDAIVMNIKTIKPKGIYNLFRKQMVEITAALDENVSYSGEKSVPQPKEQPRFANYMTQEKNKNIILEDEVNFLTESDKNKGTSAIEEKLNSLQNLLEQQMYTQKEVETEKVVEEQISKTRACIQLIKEQLITNEVDELYASQIVKEIEKTLGKDPSVDNILAGIYQKIILKLGQPQKIEKLEGKAKFVFFIGPTGVGKTTTIAKIASSFQLEKKSKVALITSDTYRIAAVDQLRTYANILGMPLKVVYTAEEIVEAREMFKDFDYVLVDTAGRSHKNKEQQADMEELLKVVPEDQKEVYLVLSATTKYNDLIRITESYREITEFKLIFTKIDETSYVGNILNLRMLTNAPLSYATWGQNVPDDIGLINPQRIAKQLLGGK